VNRRQRSIIATTDVADLTRLTAHTEGVVIAALQP
jgi:hypothetical protein